MYVWSALQADAWEEPPQKQLVLKMTDITKALQKKWLQLYWPDDGKWWPCQVVLVDPRKKTANVLYETGNFLGVLILNPFRITNLDLHFCSSQEFNSQGQINCL